MSSFDVTKLVIFQSLESHEIKTGDDLLKYVENEASCSNSTFPVELVNIENFLQFEIQMRNLLKQASEQGIVPLLHIECHGNKEDGLEFSNGSTTSWSDVAALTADLNAATHCNLFVVFSCCYGAHFLMQLSSHLKRAPALGVLGPFETVYPDEIRKAMFGFYKSLVADNDFANAVTHLKNQNLSSGYWHLEMAEEWYEMTVLSMIKNEYSNDVFEQRAREIFKQNKKRSQYISLGNIKRYFKAKNHDLYGTDFDTYFFIDKNPENRSRFEGSRLRLKNKICALKVTGQYLL